MSARTRRGLALSWSALFVLSLLLQYFSFAIATPAALAAHNENIFELDGNAVDDPANEPDDDWNSLNHAASTFFAGAATEASANDTTYFTTGGSKDENDIPSWAITSTSVPDKDQLTDAYAAVYQVNGDTWVYFGADRFDNDGDAQIGFWFFQNKVGIANGDFTGTHKNGDVLILSEYTNGGVVDLVCAYEWDGSGGGDTLVADAGDCDPPTSGSNLNLVAAGAACDVADGTFDICARTNAGAATAPWSFTNKDGEHAFATGQFFEGGINLSDMFGGQPPCFGTFLAETRSSQETDAQLKDFAFGSLDTCVPPTIATTSSVPTADFGQNVSDTANLSGANGAVTGSVKFFICTPAQVDGTLGCPTGGTQVGSAVTIVAGSATSANYTVGLTSAAVGKYCWRAEYTPDASSEYKAGSHSNNSSECFTVAPATIDITKSANPAGPVSAGDEIGFDIVVTNNGTQTTLGVRVTDVLPAGVTWTADPATGSITGLVCSIGGSPLTLTCDKPSLAANASFTVHIHGLTDKADCPSVSNSANVSTTNDGTDSASASVTVNCPVIDVTKTADAASVDAGDQIGFTVTIANTGPGEAKGLSFTDALPGGAGVSWSISPASAGWSIIGSAPNQSLVYSPTTLAANSSTSVHVISQTTKDSCKTYNNSATASATNDGSDTANASVIVNCAQIDVAKTADAASVNAGEQIGFTVTLSNNGAGAANGLTFTDALPSGAGVSWSISPASAGWSISGSAPNQVLVYSPTTLAGGASTSVHVVSQTTGESCKTYNNTATVTTTNDGQDTAGASTMVTCPDVHVLKTADNGTISAGQTAAFTIVVSNDGVGTAKNVTLNDPLPAGVAWSEDSPDCTIAAGTLTCNFGDLASGATRTIHVSGLTDAADCHLLNNTASVAATNESQADQADNSSSASITVQCPDVTVVKSADNGTINAGELAEFTITVTNLGPGTAFNVTLNDPLPAGVSWSEDSDFCSIAGGTLSCNFGTIAPNTGYEIHVSGETDAADCGTLHNVATVAASNEPASALGNNTDDADIVVNCPTIVITKTADDPSTVNAGDPVGFTITVTNTGAGSAFNVTVNDVLPTQAGLSWSIESQTGGWSIGGGALHFGPATLAGLSSTSAHIVSDTTAESCAVIPNTASVTYTGGSGSDSSSVTVQCPDIQVIKSASNSPIVAGEDAIFAITVSNEGEGTAYDVVLTDILPIGIAWVDDSADCTITAGVLTCNIGDMEPGDTFTVHLTGPTTAAACPSIPNTASATASNEPDDALANNSDGATIEVSCPDVEVIKDAPNTPIKVGEDLVFEITVTNVGNGTATDVELHDTLPAGFEWEVDDTDHCSITAGVLSCEFGDMEPDDSFTVTLTAPTDGAGEDANIDCGESLVHNIPNVATVSASNEGDDVLDNNEDDATIVVLCSELGIEKSFTGNTGGTDPILQVPAAKIGDTLHYSLEYTGAGPLNNAVITDVIPGGLEYVVGSASSDANFTFDSYDPATRTLTWKVSVNPLPDPVSGTVTYDVKVTAAAPALAQPLVNVATIDSDETEPDSDTASVAVLAPPLELTPPPTNILLPETGTSNPGFALMLVLLGVAGLALGIGFITPAPERVRRRDRNR